MSPSHNEFVVPKLRVRVVVALRGETPRPHELFVSQHEDHGWRLQDLYELLESGARFLPAFEVEARAYVVLQKAAGLSTRVLWKDGVIGRMPRPMSRWTDARDCPAPPTESFRAWWKRTDGGRKDAGPAGSTPRKGDQR